MVNEQKHYTSKKTICRHFLPFSITSQKKNCIDNIVKID